MLLFTALIGPHFIDWTTYRETFEREASAYVGRPVTVSGKASVRLLPTPVVSFTDVVVGDTETPDVAMERFRAEVELAPLLKREVRIIQMAVERPRFSVDIARLAENRTLFAGLDTDRISLERLEIVEGSAVISDSANERSWQADSIDAVLEASTLLGPGRVSANLVLDGTPVEVGAGFGRFASGDAGGAVSMNLWVTSPIVPVTLSAEGLVAVADDDPFRYEGSATIEGAQPLGEDAPPSGWADFRASGDFAVQLTDLSIDGVQISYGATERPLIVEATGRLGFGEKPSFDLTLSARQIDVDRMLAGGEGGPATIHEALGSLATRLPRVPPPPLDGVLHLDAKGIVVGGNVIQDAAVDLRPAGNSWIVEDFAAKLPGETTVDLSGTLGLASEATFLGRARMASGRPSAFAAWWRGEAGTAGRIGNFAIEADLDLTPDNQQISNLFLMTAEGTIEGSVDIRGFQQSGERVVSIDLGAERADLVETRALAELFLTEAAQASLTERTTLLFSADAEVLSAGGVEALAVSVNGGMEDGKLEFRGLSIADLAGASLESSGSIKDPLGSPSGRIEASVQADDLSGAATFLLSALPESQAVRRLAAVSAILSPVAADISAEAGAEGERLSLTLDGSFADTRIYLQAEGAGSLSKPETFAGTLNLSAAGQDSVTVLRQLGLDVLPLDAAPFRIDASFDGAVASAGEVKLAGSAVGVDFSYEGETTRGDEGIAMSGNVVANGADLDSLLLLAGIAAPGLEGHAGSVSGQLNYARGSLDLMIDEGVFNEQPVAGSLTLGFAEDTHLTGALEIAEASLPSLAGLAIGVVPGLDNGRWSDAPFTPTAPEDLSLDVSIKAGQLDLGTPISATDVTLDVALADDTLEIDLKESAFAGGTLSGTIVADMGEGQSELSLRGNIDGAALQGLVWEKVGLPVASGSLETSFQVTGRGRSLAGIVATLAGSGSFTIDDGRINALNSEALTTVMTAADGDTEPDESAARETFASLFGSGALAFGRATGSFEIANGAVIIPPVSGAAGATELLADAAIDLNTMTLTSDWTVRVDEGEAEEAQPYVPFSFAGQIARPRRDIDLVPLLNLMRSRFQDNKLKELEELERLRDEAERRAEEDEARRAAEEERRRQAALATELPAAQALAPDQPASADAPLPAETAVAPTTPAEAPQATPAPTAEPKPAPRRRARAQFRRTVPAPAPPLQIQPQPAPEPEPEYRMLPNGVIVKIR